jgi:hypothetical protein
MKFEGPTITVSGGELMVLLFTRDRSGMHDELFGFVSQSTSGGDRDDVDWPGDDVDASKVSQ